MEKLIQEHVPVNYTTLMNVAHARTDLEEIPDHNLPTTTTTKIIHY